MSYRPIRGDLGEWEILTTFRLGSLSPSTTNTSYHQPYDNEYKSVIPRYYIDESFGYDQLGISLTGRLHVYNDTATATIAAFDGGAGLLSETELQSASGASFQTFHTDVGPLKQSGSANNVEYHLKSSDGTEVEAHGYVLANIWARFD